jgi:hypothetical protein
MDSDSSLSLPDLRKSGLLRLPLSALRTLRDRVREAAIWPAAVCRREGPSVAFLPSNGRESSSFLRIYSLAESLEALGWNTLVLPPTLTLEARRRLLDRFGPDLILMQGARHPLNRPALYPGAPFVYDMDDADFHLPHLADAVSSAMGEVALVLAGSRYVADWCRARGARARVVWTGTPVSRQPRRAQADRAPIVAWAQSTPVNYIRERAFVLDVMRRVAERRPGVRLRLYGRRPGDDDRILDPFRDAGVAPEWVPAMSYGDYLRALDDVAVGLSPICPENPFSRGKSFGKILAYLDRGIPVIASDEADHARFFTPRTAVLSNEPGVWSQAILHLLDDVAARQSMADAAFHDLEARLSSQATAREVGRILESLLAPAAA